jgi:MFS family permease
MSGLIVVPQVVVAILAPWVGFHSDKRGRRPLVLIGFALEPVRGFLLAATAAYPAPVLAQVLSGVTGAVIGVLTVIVVADLTAGTGRFNLAIGVLGALSGIAASISTTVTGYLFQSLGPHLGYSPLAAVAVQRPRRAGRVLNRDLEKRTDAVGPSCCCCGLREPSLHSARAGLVGARC